MAIVLDAIRRIGRAQVSVSLFGAIELAYLLATISGLRVPGALKVAVLKMNTSEPKWARASRKEKSANR